MKPFQDLDIWSQQIEQYTIYHHQSMLNREGTVNSQKACYFHEPFNVASKDISIIYHSEASQKTLFGERMLKTPVCFPFSPSKSEAKSQINLFFFFEACLRRNLGTWTFSWGNPYQQHAHTGCSGLNKVYFFPLTSSAFLIAAYFGHFYSFIYLFFASPSR